MIVSSKSFDYNVAKNTFIAEISDLGKNFRFERVYQDSIDLGLTMLSQKTNTKMDFYISDEVRDESGDIQYWMLKPVSKKMEHQDMKIVIFND